MSNHPRFYGKQLSETNRTKVCFSFLAVLLFLLINSLKTQAGPLLKSGDRLVFLGDSITEQRIYTRYVMNYFTLRYPGVDITFRNAGIGGDVAPGGLARLQRVLDLKPTVVSICYGMNDGYWLPSLDQARYDNYIEAMFGLINRLQLAGVKVVLLTPGCIDPDRRQNVLSYNLTLTRFAEGIRKLAFPSTNSPGMMGTSIPFFNLNSLMLDVQKRAKNDDPNFTMIPDSCHPNEAGHAVMAYALLKALGCDEPASSLTINAVTATVAADLCTIKNLKVTGDAITFVRTDDALPAYFDPQARMIFKYIPIEEELNRYLFQVTGLKDGDWELKVQDVNVGVFRATELAKGLNLSVFPGPWQQLGEAVNRLSSEQEAQLNSSPKINFCETERLKAVSGNCTWRWSLNYVSSGTGSSN